ncbi:hypothetical protein C8J57DRAFT_1462438 [Mycena rebaudengoi]|nr:hypothetical protein C8J57DRAFT_1462438 [Mycena rebaudengoi]
MSDRVLRHRSFVGAPFPPTVGAVERRPKTMGDWRRRLTWIQRAARAQGGFVGCVRHVAASRSHGLAGQHMEGPVLDAFNLFADPSQSLLHLPQCTHSVVKAVDHVLEGPRELVETKLIACQNKTKLGLDGVAQRILCLLVNHHLPRTTFGSSQMSFALRRSTRSIQKLCRISSLRRALLLNPGQARKASLDPGLDSESNVDGAVDWTKQVLPRVEGRIQLLRTTIAVHNVPPNVSTSEFLELILFGPLHTIDDRIRQGSRVISLTFFEPSTAAAFYAEVTGTEFILYGSRLTFSWGQGPIPRRIPGTRAIYVHDTSSVGTFQKIQEISARHGPIDRLKFLTQSRKPVFIDYFSSVTARRVVADLREDGVQVAFTDDRCWVAGRLRAAALKSHSRQVTLANIPPRTSIHDICDQIRGGSLDKIILASTGDVAFVHFILPSSAALFYQYALYHGISIGNARLIPHVKGDSAAMKRLRPPAPIEEEASIASRCLLIKFPEAPKCGLDAEVLKKRLEHYGGQIEHIEVSESSAAVSFTDRRDAVDARNILPSKWHCEVSFMEDPCSRPYRQLRQPPAVKSLGLLLNSRHLGVEP